MGDIVSPHFVGRVDELSRLREALVAATEGRSGAVVVGGEGGVGKSRLVTEFLLHARGRGALVLTGGCIKCRGGGPPYWAFIDALRRFFHEVEGDGPLEPDVVDAAVAPFRPELARLLPELGQDVVGLTGAGLTAAPLPPYAAVLGVLTRLSERRPLVLVVEDLQWADRSTQDLLSFLLTNLGRNRMLVVATYRSDAIVPGHSLRPWLAELRRNRRADLVELARFTRKELTAQLEAILAAPPPRGLVENIWSRSQGNAFFAEELLAARATAGPRLPATLSQVLLARVEVLSDAARQVLRMLATGGQGVSHGLLAAVAGVPATLPEGDLLDALRECVADQILVADDEGDSYQFRHSLLQEAVYDDLLPGERARFHAAYARALEEGASAADVTTAAKLAHHWERAGDHGRALSAALAAATTAEALYGFAEADQHLERALQLWSVVPDAAESVGLDRPGLLERAADAADMAGDHRRASVLVKDAMSELGPQADPTRLALLQQRLGRYLWASGDSEAALVAYEEAVERIAPATGTAEWARIVAAYAEALLRAGRYRESAQQAEAALDVARQVGARADEGHLLATLGFDLAFLGDPAAGVSLLDESLRVAVELGNPNDVGRAYLNLAELLSGPLNRLAEGASMAEAGVEHVRRLGLERSYGVSLRAIAINTLFRLGRWPDADVLLSQALELQPTGAEAIELRLARARLSVGRGDFAAATSELDEVTRMCARATDVRHQAPLLTLIAGLALWEGRLDDARQAVAKGLEQALDSEDTWVVAPLVWHGLRAESDVAELARARSQPGGVAEASSAGEALLAQVASLGERSTDAAAPVRKAVAAWALMCEAELARLDGASSPDAWGQAATIWEELGQPYPAAYARWREGEALLGLRARSARATEVLRSAYEVAQRLAAAPLARQIELLAERARIRLDPPDAADAPGSGAAAATAEPVVPAALAMLTKRERHVLLLVAEGQTNRQIAETLYISDKTASVHVSHILAKLGVSSRVQASAVAHRLGLVAPG